MRENIRVFEENWRTYDEWYERNERIYLAEINALKKIVHSGKGLEIGVGTGRFAVPLGVDIGLDPSFNMLHLAKKRNIKPVQGMGENLPFKNESFNFVIIVLTICFVENTILVLSEASRILTKKGKLILAIINKESPWGKHYVAKAVKNKFYKFAHFFSPEEIIQKFKEISLEFKSSYQILFSYPYPPILKENENPRAGYEKGGFVILEALKN